MQCCWENCSNENKLEEIYQIESCRNVYQWGESALLKDLKNLKKNNSMLYCGIAFLFMEVLVDPFKRIYLSGCQKLIPLQNCLMIRIFKGCTHRSFIIKKKRAKKYCKTLVSVDYQGMSNSPAYPLWYNKEWSSSNKEFEMNVAWSNKNIRPQN